MMINTAIIGCGRIAGYNENKINPNTHAGAYSLNPHCKLVACLDKDFKKAESFGSFYNCTVVNSIEELIDSYSPDIISVTTPDDTHFSITKQLIMSKKAPKVIFLEKPACSNHNEYEELIKLSKNKNVSIVVNHSRRFDEHHKTIRERIIKGEFGTLYRCNSDYYSGWKHNGVHIIDTLSFLFNDELHIIQMNGEIKSPYENDPTFELELAFDKNPGRIIINGMEEKYYQLFELDMRFTDARLRIENFGERIILERKTINDIGENVLVLTDNGLFAKQTTSMQNAINLISKRLLEDNSSILEGYRLKNIFSTMKTIWKVKDEFKNRS